MQLPIGARRDLLRVLTAPAFVRADLIRQMHERPDTHELADALMDVEADELIRFQVIDLLEQSTSVRPAVGSSGAVLPSSDLLRGILPGPRALTLSRAMRRALMSARAGLGLRPSL